LVSGTILLATAQALLAQSILGRFSRGSVELGLSGFQNGRRIIKHLPLNSPKNRGETEIFAESDVEIKDTGQQN